jgi:hypothetical protein
MLTKLTKTLAAAALLAGGVAMTTAAARQDADEAAIRESARLYFDGGTNADSNALRQAFHPDAKMLYVRDGKYVAVPIGEYITRVGSGKPAAPGAAPQKRVVAIDRFGNAATAKLEQRRPDGSVIVDYMSLLKVDGRWMIVNKIFDRQ